MSKVSERHVNKFANWIVGMAKTDHKKDRLNRMEVMQKAMESPFNFFFDVTPDGNVSPAPFADISPFLELPAEQFGDPTQWLPDVGMSRYIA